MSPSRLLLAAAILCSMAVTSQAGTEMALVCDGTSARAATQEEQESDNPPQDLVVAWVWSDTEAPRPIDRETWATRSRPQPAARELRVRTTSARTNASIEVIAGPPDMWQLIPEALMPRWALADDGTVALPRTSGSTWRVRAVGDGVGSTWVDVPSGRDSIAVGLVATEDLNIEVVGEDRIRVEASAAVVFREAAGGFRHTRSNIALIAGDKNGLRLDSAPPAEKLKLMVLSDQFRPLLIEGRLPALPRRVVLQPGAQVHGRAVDQENENPIVGARVEVEYWPDNTVKVAHRKTATTNSDGVWSVRGLPDGTLGLAQE